MIFWPMSFLSVLCIIKARPNGTRLPNCLRRNLARADASAKLADVDVDHGREPWLRQEHRPGRLGLSDFTAPDGLNSIQWLPQPMHRGTAVRATHSRRNWVGKRGSVGGTHSYFLGCVD